MFNSIVEAIFYYAEKTPDALFAADNKQSFTYGQSKNAILRTAMDLKELGVGQGDCVVVECTQNAAYCICQQAIALIGAVFVPFDRKMAADRLAEIINETEAVCYAGTNKNASGLTFFSTASITPTAEAVSFSWQFPHADQRSELLYSTGTTGKAKGIDISHRNNIALAENVAGGVRMETGNVEIVPVSLSHSHGLRTLYANFMNGNAVVIASGVTFLKPFFSLIERWNVNAMDLVPSAWRILYEHSRTQLENYQDQIRYIQLGSAPLTEEDKRTLKKCFPKSRLYNFYGSTESGRTCTYDFAAWPDKVNCIGKPVTTAEVLIVDSEHQPVEDPSAERTGYLAFRGAMNMSGYWKNPELTKSIMQDGIIYTKDIGYKDAENWVYMLGRDDDIINFGGVKINPADIEEAAMKCPGVFDCGCVGCPDPVSGQTPWLFVQFEPDSDHEIKTVSVWLSQNLDREKMPNRIIEIDELPRTFNGKLLRRDLRKLAENMQ